MDIKHLFEIVYDSKDFDDDDKKALYSTIREILKHRRSLGVNEEVGSLFSDKGYDAVFTHFVECYSGDESKKHIENLDTLHSIYLDMCDSEPCGEETEPESDDASDADYSSGDDDEGVVNVIVDVTSSIEQALVPNRWLLGLNAVLSFGNFVLTAFMIRKLVLPLY